MAGQTVPTARVASSAHGDDYFCQQVTASVVTTLLHLEEHPLDRIAAFIPFETEHRQLRSVTVFVLMYAGLSTILGLR